jgi:hypothetical protein
VKLPVKTSREREREQRKKSHFDDDDDDELDKHTRDKMQCNVKLIIDLFLAAKHHHHLHQRPFFLALLC